MYLYMNTFDFFLRLLRGREVVIVLSYDKQALDSVITKDVIINIKCKCKHIFK